MSSDSDRGTRERILESAARLFAERGFRVTTVKDICADAGANVAAVNYYFGSKGKLIDAVWAHTSKVMRETHGRLGVEQLSPPERLESLVRVRLLAVLDDGPGGLFPKIIFRALSEFDHEALEALFHQHLRLHMELLDRTIRALLPEDASEQEIAAGTLCVHSPCIHLNVTRREKRGPFRGMQAEEWTEEALIEPMVAFAVGGIHALRDRIAARASNPSASQ